MKVAIATDDYVRVAGHAGQARRWLVHDSADGGPQPQRIRLEKTQVFHHWQEDGPHPLDGVSVIVAGSAGDGFLRRMAKRGVEVRLTGERDAARALAKVLDGQPLATPPFDPTRLLCRVRDLFSKH